MGHFSGLSDWCVSKCAFKSLKGLPQSGCGQRVLSRPSSSKLSDPGLSIEVRELEATENLRDSPLGGYGR